jgi:cytidyltransferase-like protein
MENIKTVAIFGTFDGIHEGHRDFIRQAREYGEQLVAIVARDTTVEKLKNKLPLHDEKERIKMLLEIPEIDLVLLGDVEEGTYKALMEVNPSVVYLGYDQQALSDNIKKAMKEGIVPKVELILGKPHKPESMHSSILNK